MARLCRKNRVGGTIEAHGLRNPWPDPKKGKTLRDDQTTIAELKNLVAQFVAEREWEPFHDPKNLSASIAIEAAELMEHFQWLRPDELDAIQEDREKMVLIGEELADITAYLVSCASVLGVDLSAALADKMKKNAIKYPADEFRGRSGNC